MSAPVRYRGVFILRARSGRSSRSGDAVWFSVLRIGAADSWERAGLATIGPGASDFLGKRKGLAAPASANPSSSMVARARNYRYRRRSKLTSCEAPRDPVSRRWETGHDG